MVLFYNFGKYKNYEHEIHIVEIKKRQINIV